MLRSKLFGPFLNWELRKQVRALNFYAEFIGLWKDNSFSKDGTKIFKGHIKYS